MEMSGLSSVGWNVGGGSKASEVSGNNHGGNNFGHPASSIAPGTALWRGTSCVPLNNGTCQSLCSLCDYTCNKCNSLLVYLGENVGRC
jgi:hypothetical protein